MALRLLLEALHWPSDILTIEGCVPGLSAHPCAHHRYARQVEITNGRWAMLGFLTAIIIEAGTGRGILLQLVGYAKALNLLGPASGVNL